MEDIQSNQDYPENHGSKGSTIAGADPVRAGHLLNDRYVVIVDRVDLEAEWAGPDAHYHLEVLAAAACS
ncbi:hypothetical protein DOE73_21175 [Paenibacillus dendritiformis]|nr:hypothetical protein DOE73_21175 [Paenibacillus dendritiformis]